ncbi:MAG: hypothetical protein R3C28_25960 [Pirellulaceae bacterium]
MWNSNYGPIVLAVLMGAAWFHRVRLHQWWSDCLADIQDLVARCRHGLGQLPLPFWCLVLFWLAIPFLFPKSQAVRIGQIVSALVIGYLMLSRDAESFRNALTSAAAWLQLTSLVLLIGGGLAIYNLRPEHYVYARDNVKSLVRQLAESAPPTADSPIENVRQQLVPTATATEAASAAMERLETARNSYYQTLLDFQRLVQRQEVLELTDAATSVNQVELQAKQIFSQVDRFPSEYDSLHQQHERFFQAAADSHEPFQAVEQAWVREAEADYSQNQSLADVNLALSRRWQVYRAETEILAAKPPTLAALKQVIVQVERIRQVMQITTKHRLPPSDRPPLELQNALVSLHQHIQTLRNDMQREIQLLMEHIDRSPEKFEPHSDLPGITAEPLPSASARPRVTPRATYFPDSSYQPRRDHSSTVTVHLTRHKILNPFCFQLPLGFASQLGRRFAYLNAPFYANRIQLGNHRRNILVRNHDTIPRYDFISHSLSNSIETAIHRIGRPWLPHGIPKELDCGVQLHLPLGNLQGNICQIHDSWNTTSFGFAGRNEPALIAQINVPCFDSQDLLRTTAGLTSDHNQVAQGVIGDVIQDATKFVVADCGFSPLCRGHFDMLYGIRIDVALFCGPSERSFHRTKIVSACCFGEFVRINPFVQMKWFEFVHAEIGILFAETLATRTIPLVCVRALDAAAPIPRIDR